MKLGAASYALYLIHPVVILACLGFTGMPWMFLLLTVGLSLVAAELLHRYIEKPTIEIGRRATRASGSGSPSLPLLRRVRAARRR